MPRPVRLLAKVTAKNQLTLPRAALEALGWPTHFRVQVAQGALVLWPGLLVTEAEAARMLGLETAALRRVREESGAGAGMGQDDIDSTQSKGK